METEDSIDLSETEWFKGIVKRMDELKVRINKRKGIIEDEATTKS